MDLNPSTRVPPAPASLPKAARAHARRSGTRRMCIGILFTATAIGTLAVLSSLLATAPTQVANNAASRPAANTSGRIVLHPDEKGCESRRFDNQTGQISEAAGPCRNETRLDAKGLPMPTGTVNTMQSISKSFR